MDPRFRGDDTYGLPMIIANWKMNGNKALVDAYLKHFTKDMPLVVCPPYPFIPLLSTSLTAGAQDCHMAESGAFTGEVSARMLADVRCRYVILGHAERRAQRSETQDMIKAKIAQALKYDLQPIVCVAHEDEWCDLPLDDVYVAWEPLSAIGSNSVASPEVIEKVRSTIPCARFFYGGSVTQDNIESLVGCADGVLVGGASLNVGHVQRMVETWMTKT